MNPDKASPTQPAAKNPLWGGRFSHAQADLMRQINASIQVDKRLYREDITASIAHASMLSKQGIISEGDAAKITDGLREIEQRITAMGPDKFPFDEAFEDIHMNIEQLLGELVGREVAGRLHTARSRNDQVAVDLRLWLNNQVGAVRAEMVTLIGVLLDRAEEHSGTIMPGFTHLQVAQPVTLGHHLMAYVEMLGRDLSRLDSARLRMMADCPLGAAALAGTSFPLDRHHVAGVLGFAGPSRNSLDSVSDRDFAVEFMSVAAICATHMSRLAEEMVLWSSPLVGFVRLSDAFSTGSSIMPQKRNPDAAELVRAKSGRVTGNLMGMLSILKALPLAYSKDLQEDKEAVFDSVDSLRLMLQAMAGMVADMTVNADRMLQAAGTGFSTATDLADWLVQECRIPFRDAHHASGRAVKLAESLGVASLDQLTLEQLQKEVHPQINSGVYARLGIAESVMSRSSFGGTAPSQVQGQINYWREELARRLA